MKIFTKPVRFSRIDPLGDGLRELIFAEQQESQAISLDDEIDEDVLLEYWKSIETDSTEIFGVKLED